MKKIVLWVLVLVMATGIVACDKTDADKKESVDVDYDEFDLSKQKSSENLDILTSGEWEYGGWGCAYVLIMGKDGKFSNWCACGSPAGYSDMVEYYLYDDDTKIIYLYDSEKQLIGEGEVLSISEDEVTIEKYDEVCEYKLVEEF